MVCKICNDPKYKTWEGQDPKCAFESGVFSEDNWNCGTVNLIRDLCYQALCYQAWPIKDHPLQEGIYVEYLQDRKYAILNVTDVHLTIRDVGEWIGWSLWLCWYKNRGATEQMWILGHETPKRPTEGDCLAIFKHYQMSKEDRQKNICAFEDEMQRLYYEQEESDEKKP